MEMTLGYLLDGALMVLLGVAIWFGIRLNRQIKAIRDGRKELEGLINAFTGATDRAESALADLKQEVGVTLSQARQSARQAAELCDDLEFLIKRGDKVADGLEHAVRGGQDLMPRAMMAEDHAEQRERGQARQSRAQPSRQSAMAGARSEAQTPQSAEIEDSLLQDALAAARQETPESDISDPRDPQTRASPSIGRAAPELQGSSTGSLRPDRGRSKTDLLKALRDMR